MRHALFNFDVLQSYTYMSISDGMVENKKAGKSKQSEIQIKENEGMQFKI